MQWELVTLVILIPLGILVLTLALIWNLGYLGAAIATVIITLAFQATFHILSSFGRPNGGMGPNYKFTLRKIIEILALGLLIFAITASLAYIKQRYF